jgi:hypothetical protein
MYSEKTAKNTKMFSIRISQNKSYNFKKCVVKCFQMYKTISSHVENDFILSYIEIKIELIKKKQSKCAYVNLNERLVSIKE